MDGYRYTECGLDNVIIEGLAPTKDDNGDECLTVENIRGLHRTIAEAVVNQARGLTAKELRFLRTELGMTQSELAERLLVDAQTIGRWERAEHDMDKRSDLILRMLAKELLKVESTWTVENKTRELAPSAKQEPIKIDGTDPQHYKIAA